MKIVNAKRLFVGLDYHQDFVQVCVLDESGKVVRNSRVENSRSKIVVAVPAGGLVHSALEACCGAADLADELAERADWSVSLAHPGFVARMKQNPDKTDFSDARLLADLLRVGYLPKVWLAPAELRELRRLVRFRQQKVNERRDVKLRLRALLRDHRIKDLDGNPWTQKWLAGLAALGELGQDTAWIMQQHLASLARLNTEIREIEKRLWTPEPCLKKSSYLSVIVSRRCTLPPTRCFSNRQRLRQQLMVFLRAASRYQTPWDTGAMPRKSTPPGGTMSQN